MFERFTRDAREVVRDAVRLARAEQAPRVDTEHLLLAVLDQDGDGAALLARAGLRASARQVRARLAEAHRRGGLSAVDATALQALGVDVDAVLAAVEGHLGHDALNDASAARGRRGLGMLSPAAKQVLGASLRAAAGRSDRRLGEEHLVLAMLRTAGPVCDLLADEGVTRDTVERALRTRRNAS